MLKAIWRRFLADKVARSIEARMAPSLDARIDAIMERIEALMSRMQASQSQAQASASQRMEDLHVAARQHAAESVRSQADLFRTELTEMAGELRAEIRTVKDGVGLSDETAGTLISRLERAKPWARTMFVPKIGLASAVDLPFMAYSTCSAADCQSEAFAGLCREMAHTPMYHRKLWEFAFIIHHLRRLEAVGPGKRGLVFGVGTEPLPSIFAMQGARIMATDAPEEIGVNTGWNITNEYASKAEDIRNPAIIDQERFSQLVSYATCDMNNIGEDFTDFDFCWSSCCFEHLGSLEAGIEFVVNSVEKTLRVGGIACHTTEFNLSSDEETVRDGQTVIYRKQDMERLIARLRDRGHRVDDLRIAPDSHPLDFFVDVPPYAQKAHLKLNLMGYVSTSVGLVIRRGR